MLSGEGREWPRVHPILVNPCCCIRLPFLPYQYNLECRRRRWSIPERRGRTPFAIPTGTHRSGSTALHPTASQTAHLRWRQILLRDVASASRMQQGGGAGLERRALLPDQGHIGHRRWGPADPPRPNDGDSFAPRTELLDTTLRSANITA